MRLLKTLKAKLVYIALVSMSVSILPTAYVFNNFSRRVEKCRQQVAAVALLDSVAEIANASYKKSAGLDFDKKAQSRAFSALQDYGEKTLSDRRQKSLLKNSLDSLRSKTSGANAIPDIAGVISARGTLFSDSRSGIRILLDTSGVSIPSIMSDMFVFRKSAAKQNSETKSVETSIIALQPRLVGQMRAMISSLGKSGFSTDYKIASEIFEKANRLNTQILKTEKSVSQFGQGDAPREQVLENIDLLQSNLFELWLAANRNLETMLEVKSATVWEGIYIFAGFFALVLLLAITAAAFAIRAINRAVASFAAVVDSASAGDIASARADGEKLAANFPELRELTSSASALVEFVSDLTQTARDIANAANRVNLMLSGMSATKLPLLVAVEDSFAEANRQVRSDYDFVLQESARLGECAAQMISIERDLKNARKLGISLKQNFDSITKLSETLSAKSAHSRDILEKISKAAQTLSSCAEKVNLLGLNLSVISRKLGEHSEGAETLSAQIRDAAKQISASSESIDAMGKSASKTESELQSDSAKIGEISASSNASSAELDSLTLGGLSDISGVGGSLSSVASSLRSNISSKFEYSEPAQDLDEVRDAIKDMSAIVKRSSETISSLRTRLRLLF